MNKLLITTLLLCLFASSGQAADKRIAITIDDLPVAALQQPALAERQAITRQLLAALREHGAKAVGFVNEDQLYQRGQVDASIALLEQWLDGGMELGNHGYGHLSFWSTPLAVYQDAVLHGEVQLRRLLGERKLPLRYYRHPYNQSGRNAEEQAAFQAFLTAHGYTLAPFTIEHDDYLFACVDERTPAPQRASMRERLLPAYLSHLRTAVQSYEAMSEALFGRQIPHILLIHANRLNADTLGQTLASLREQGYRFISLDEALQDEAYRAPTLPSKQFGPSWLTRWARQRGTKLSVYGHPDPSGWVAEQAATLCKF